MTGIGSHLGQACLAFALVGAMGSPAFAQYAPGETLASTNRWMLDLEFNHAKGQFTWVDPATGSIWVGGIDGNGELSPPNGQSVLIEKGAAPIGGLGFTLNGPEWAFGDYVDYVVYTRFPFGAAPTAANAQIAIAWQQTDGSWARRVLSPTEALNGPYGSVSKNGPARISYNDAYGNHYWREVANAATQEPLPGLAGAGLTPVVRWVHNETAVVYPVTVGGVAQAFQYNVVTKAFTQLTYDAGNKDQLWMWHAPDQDNELVLLATVDKSTLVLYRQGYDSAGIYRWLPVSSVQAPPGMGWFSTEPFVYQNKSYVLMQSIVGPYPSAIWLANFDASDPLLRRLTPELPERARADPEVVFTNRGPIVLFSRFDPSKGPQWLCLACLEGLYRAETGLPPPQ